MKVFTQRALSYARDSLKVYSNFRKKAKTLVDELIQKGIHQVYIEGDDELIDILRLTCIESGINLLETPIGVILIADGQEYCMVVPAEHPDDN
jgi:hypothetical protein